MPVVTTAQLAKVLSLLLRKDTSRLEATVSAFSTQYPASDRFAVLCSVTAHLQVRSMYMQIFLVPVPACPLAFTGWVADT